jgi:hypothetical protein
VFLRAAGERYYPQDDGLRKLWRREIARWLAAGITEQALVETIRWMRKEKLSIVGPQSVTGMAIDYMARRAAADDEYPLFVAAEES